MRQSEHELHELKRLEVPMTLPLLSVDRISVSYGAVQALCEASLEVKAGEIVALLGANGAGKSTMLKAIMQMVSVRRRAIQYEGADLTRLKTYEIVKSGIALVPEGRGILGTMSVLENLELGGYHQELRANDFQEVFLLFPRLKERLQQIACTLSGGEQQMLALARALLSKPKLLLLDEPSLGLAPLIIQDIFRLISQIRDRGISILLIEQNAHMAMKVADRAYVLETGRIVLSGPCEELKNDENLRKAYLGG